MSAGEFPEHEKLREIAAKSQAAGDFLERLEALGLHLCEFVEEAGVWGDGGYVRTNKSRETVLALVFDIDLTRLEAEKRSMLEAQRALNAVRSAGGS
jgi:hypothetical protein